MTYFLIIVLFLLFGFTGNNIRENIPNDFAPDEEATFCWIKKRENEVTFISLKLYFSLFGITCSKMSDRKLSLQFLVIINRCRNIRSFSGFTVVRPSHIHPSIFFCSSRTDWCGQQSKKRCPEFPLLWVSPEVDLLMERKTASQCSRLPWKHYIHLTLLMVQLSLLEGMGTSQTKHRVTCILWRWPRPNLNSSPTPPERSDVIFEAVAIAVEGSGYLHHEGVPRHAVLWRIHSCLYMGVHWSQKFTVKCN